ncbi:MAG: phosphoribosylglycinamide formyltransferase [Synechococcus sp. BS301-5m-G53]|nr:phosphoribosylglycinamide formyltransferase [Synechococcus sp. BS301-5m-G53]
MTDPSHNNRADQTPLQLGVMASGNGSNFEALAQAIQAGDLNARIQRLVVNNPGCGAQQRAERLGIPVSVLDHRLIKDRRELDAELVRLFRADRVELVVMAGWMRIVTEVLVSGFSDRLINIHPSLLPSFRGLDAIGQALQAGVKVTGCTVHIVTEELDAGPILAQAAVPVLDGDDHATLAKRIQEQEHLLLPKALAGLKPTWRQG